MTVTTFNFDILIMVIADLLVKHFSINYFGTF